MLATALVAGFGSAAVAAWGLGTRLEFFDPQTKELYTPYVVEPAGGIDRMALTFLIVGFDLEATSFFVFGFFGF